MLGTDSYSIVIDISKQSNIDYRYSELELVSIDSPKMTTKEPIKAKLLGEGVVRLYREFEENCDDIRDSNDINANDHKNSVNNIDKDHGDIGKDCFCDDTIVSILAVPTYFTAIDLLGFIGQTFLNNITHIRILKSEKPNRFLVLLKFIDEFYASDFQYQFNGKPFNSMEPESCHVVFVKSIKLDGKIHKSIKKGANDLIPFLMEDPFTIDEDFHKNNTSIELPTCPVCLERMDATISGLLTIPCLHTFHCQCLSKWIDDTCPICRYSNNISNQKVRRTMRRLLNISLRNLVQTGSSNSNSNNLSTFESSEMCSNCDANNELWICLICGNVGCSRYAPQQHSLKHFVDTGHCFAMEISTSRVWDYAGDNYVHRLVTNESDGKLVELPDKNSTAEVTDKLNSNFDKAEEVGFEYSQLLISQLASQREYYELLLSQRENDKSRKGSILSNRLNSFCQHDQDVKFRELDERMNTMESVISSLKEKLNIKDDKIKVISQDLNASRYLNEALSKKVEYFEDVNKQLKERIEVLEGEKLALSEEVTDLMFFLDNQEKFKDEPQEVKNGTLILQPKPGAFKGNLKKKKKK